MFSIDKLLVNDCYMSDIAYSLSAFLELESMQRFAKDEFGTLYNLLKGTYTEDEAAFACYFILHLSTLGIELKIEIAKKLLMPHQLTSVFSACVSYICYMYEGTNYAPIGIHLKEIFFNSKYSFEERYTVYSPLRWIYPIVNFISSHREIDPFREDRFHNINSEEEFYSLFDIKSLRMIKKPLIGNVISEDDIKLFRTGWSDT